MIAYYLQHKNLTYNSICKLKDEISAIWKFIKIVQIKTHFTSGLDGKLTAAINEIKSCSDFSDFNKRMAENQRLKVTSDDIDWMMELDFNNKTYLLPVLQTLYPNLDYKNSTFHIDHIYPRSKFNESNSKLDLQLLGYKDSIINLQLLEGSENIIKRDTDPATWVQQHFGNDSCKIQNYKTSNYIDPSCSLYWSEFQSFLIYRSAKIKEVLTDALT